VPKTFNFIFLTKSIQANLDLFFTSRIIFLNRQLLKISPTKSSKKLAVFMKFAFMSVELFLLCKSHFLQK